MTRLVRYALRVARECKKKKPLSEADKKYQRVLDAQEAVREKE